jgi:hypothetical protein
MANPGQRKVKEFRARAIFGVMPEVDRQEVVIWFRGEPREEKFDLGVRIQAPRRCPAKKLRHGPSQRVFPRLGARHTDDARAIVALRTASISAIGTRSEHLARFASFQSNFMVVCTQMRVQNQGWSKIERGFSRDRPPGATRLPGAAFRFQHVDWALSQRAANPTRQSRPQLGPL